MPSKQAPGEDARIEAMGQTRDGQGRFSKKAPLAIDAVALDEILVRRNKVLELGERWQPTLEEWDKLAQQVLALHAVGHSLADISGLLQVPQHTTRRALAHATAEKMTPKDREKVRYWATALLENIIDLALAREDLAEARKATMNYLQALGLVSTGGNVNVGVQVNHLSDTELESEIRAWMSGQNEIEEAVILEEKESEEHDVRADGI